MKNGVDVDRVVIFESGRLDGLYIVCEVVRAAELAIVDGDHAVVLGEAVPKV